MVAKITDELCTLHAASLDTDHGTITTEAVSMSASAAHHRACPDVTRVYAPA